MYQHTSRSLRGFIEQTNVMVRTDFQTVQFESTERFNFHNRFSSLMLRTG